MNPFLNIQPVSPTNTLPTLPNVVPCKQVQIQNKTWNTKSFMLSPPTNSVQAFPPIPTYMMRLPYNFGPVSHTNDRATQVQRTHFSKQKQTMNKNGKEKSWQKLSFKTIPTKHTFPYSHVSYLSPDLSHYLSQQQLLSHHSSKNNTTPPHCHSTRQRQKKRGGGLFFLLFSSFSLDLCSITIHKTNKTK